MRISIVLGKYQPMILFRPFKWIFRKDWYSLYRWRKTDNYPFSTDTVRLIDIGMLSIGYTTMNDKVRLKS